MKVQKDIIYTSLDGFSLKRRSVKHISDLEPVFQEWISECSMKLMNDIGQSERIAGEQLKQMFLSVETQVFFMINGRSYFLDFYIPSRKLAVEIDGGYHATRVKEDKLRDNDFNSIGIRTIRISNVQVEKGLLLKIISTKSEPRKRHKKKGNKSSNKMIAKAYKRLRQHDSHKHLASWI